MAESHRFSRLDCLLTGLFYVGLGLTGGISFMAVRPELLAAGEPAQTLANLIQRPDLARMGVGLELGAVTFQALAAIWFARLFQHVDLLAGIAIALFGIVNAVATLASAAMTATALEAALGSTGADPAISHLLLLAGDNFWHGGAIFFGLWLIPMGWLVLQSGFGPRALGWLLVIGGAGYVASVFIGVLAPNAGLWVGALPLLATVGEFWMIGLLFWKALKPANKANAME